MSLDFQLIAESDKLNLRKTELLSNQKLYKNSEGQEAKPVALISYET